MPSSHWTCASGAKLTVTAASFIAATSFCDNEFSMVLQPATASTTASAANRAVPHPAFKARPRPQLATGDILANILYPQLTRQARRPDRGELPETTVQADPSAPHFTQANKRTRERDMNAQAAPKHAASPQTPPLPQA